MKKIIISYIVCLLMYSTMQAQVSKTIDLSSAGTLVTKMTSNEFKSVDNLTITGKMDARDFKFLRDSMILNKGRTGPIQLLNISDVSIVTYIGKDGTYLYKKYEETDFGAAYDLIELDSVVTYPENTLPQYAFERTFNYKKHYLGQIKKIILPNGLNYIGSYALSGNIIADSTILIPSTVKEIGDYAFYNNYSLKSIVIPSSVILLGKAAFNGCDRLKNITIPVTVTSIKEYVFANCDGLDSVNIASVTIGNGMFESCQNLKKVIFQPSVTKIGKYAFNQCTMLSNLKIPSNITTIGEYAFKECISLKIVDFPSSITNIEKGAFVSCSSLFMIRLRSSETKISEYAFGRNSLKSIYIYSNPPILLDSLSLDHYQAQIHVPPGTKSLYINHKDWGKFKNINDDNGVTFTVNGINYNVTGKDSAYVTLGEYSGSILIPEFVKYLGVDYTVSAIEPYAFGYSDVKEVIIPTTVTKIEDGTFSNSYLLSKIIIPSSVSSIGEKAFYLCGSLKSISLPISLKSIGISAFEYCKISDLTVPTGVVSIGHSAFSSCDDLKTVNLPSSLRTIGNSSFYRCTNIKELAIPAGVYSIGDNAFEFCDSLKTVSFSSSLKTFGKYSFANCPSISELIIPAGVDSIGEGAFAGCASVTKVSIPASVKNIGKDAFFLCGGTFSVDTNNTHYLMKNGMLCKKSGTTLYIIKCPVDLASVSISSDMEFYYAYSSNPFVACKGKFQVDAGHSGFALSDSLLFLTNKYNNKILELMKYPASKTGAYTISNSVSGVTMGAFYGCKGLTEITYPLTLRIEGGFGACSKLTNIYIKHVKGAIEKNGSIYIETPDMYKSGVYYGLSNNFDKSITTLNLPWHTTHYSGYKSINNQFSPFGYFRSIKNGNANLLGTWEASGNQAEWIPTESIPSLESNGVEINDTLNISDSLMIPSLRIIGKGNLIVNSSAKLLVRDYIINNNNGLKLLSDENSTATFIGPKENSVYFNLNRYGITYVDQYLTAGRNWYISSPIADAKSAVFKAAEINNSVYWYDEAKGNTTPWQPIKDNETVLGVGKGYVYSPSKAGIITFNGTLNFKKYNLNLTRTKGHVHEGYNLIGNPFTAYLDWSKTKTEGIIPSIWYKTTAASNSSTVEPSYLFQSYNVLADISTKNGDKVATKMIPPMQAFWVRVAEGKSTAKVEIDPDLRRFKDLAGNKLKVKSQISTAQSILRLDVSNGSYTDQAVVYLNSNALNSFDNYDTPKMLNNSMDVADIYTISGKEHLAINGLNTLTYDSELKIGFNTLKPGKFTITASEFNNFESDTKLLLKDYVNNTITDLSNDGSYSFSSGVTNTTSRFALLFRSPASSNNVDSNPTKSVWITEANGMLQINGNVAQGSSLDVYNFMGQQVISKTLNAGSNQNSILLNAGVYIVTLTQKGLKTTQKFILK